jgi:hypothetical protein
MKTALCPSGVIAGRSEYELFAWIPVLLSTDSRYVVGTQFADALAQVMWTYAALERYA